MATVIFPNSFALFLLSTNSLVFVLLILCSSKKSYANFQGTKTSMDSEDCHILHINSLLPSPVCNSSTKADLNKKSSLQVVHKHGPCSQLHQDKTKKPPTHAETLFQDEARVRYIQSRLAKNSGSRPYVKETDAANLPTRDGSVLGTGDYIVTVGLGTPKKELSLIFDTGSDITWTQCEPCAAYCYQQKDKKFNPSESSTYFNVSCNSEPCNSLLSATVKFTPLSKGFRDSSFYGLDVTLISVGGKKLSISASVFTTAGAIIDSGTVITRLPPAAYAALRSAFRQRMSQYPMGKEQDILDTCYNFSNYKSVIIPKISFFFRGGVELTIPLVGTLNTDSVSEVCLAFAANDDASDVSIFGNTQQKTLQVVYDGVGKRVGFAIGGCQ